MVRKNCIAATLVSLLLCAAAADAKSVRFVSSGAGSHSQEADSDGSMSGGGYNVAQGHGTFGQYSATGAGDLGDWDGVSFCDFDEGGAPRGVLLTYLTTSQVLRFQNGDLLFLELSAAPASTLCFNFIDNRSFTFEAHNDIVGGTGKFTGATGRVGGKGSGVLLQSLSAFESVAEGDIVLNK